MLEDRKRVRAFLALGSNLGDSRALLAGGRESLDRAEGIRVSKASALYRTEPQGGPEGQPPYLNAVLEVETLLPPRALLERCLAVEALFGRERQELWGPRTLDIDILFYGGEVLQEVDLRIPHPRLHERSFVLIPLLDLAPELVHPVLGLTVRQMAASLPNPAPILRLAHKW